MSRSSLFSKLLSLTSSEKIIRKEDFFTEIFARLLREEKIQEILSPLLFLSNKPQGRYSVETQVKYEALDEYDHIAGSRPDIKLISYNRDEIIFIENKIDSREEPGQLKRYAEHLDEELQNNRKVERAYLIYITRDWEEKDEIKIKEGCDKNSNISFVPLRWHEICRSLKNSDSEDEILNEAVRFMEENNMAHNNQFNSVDILTLMNYSKLETKLKQVMDKEMDKILKDLPGAGNIKGDEEVSYKNRKIRYVDLNVLGEKLGMWIGYGFSFDPPVYDGYPDLVVKIEVRDQLRKNVLFEKVVEVLQTKLKDGWDNREEKAQWYGIMKRKSIKDILSTDDHIIEARRFFKNTISEIKKEIMELESLI